MPTKATVGEAAVAAPPRSAPPGLAEGPPPALTKDLLGRMIAWRIQENFYGGHDKATLRLLDGLARG
jgi:hypothetical protein